MHFEFDHRFWLLFKVLPMIGLVHLVFISRLCTRFVETLVFPYCCNHVFYDENFKAKKLHIGTYFRRVHIAFAICKLNALQFLVQVQGKLFHSKSPNWQFKFVKRDNNNYLDTECFLNVIGYRHSYEKVNGRAENRVCRHGST